MCLRMFGRHVGLVCEVINSTGQVVFIYEEGVDIIAPRAGTNLKWGASDGRQRGITLACR